MKTKSSLFRILWSSAYVVVVVVGLRIATGAPESAGLPSPQQNRTVTKKPWRLEPVKVVAARNKKKEQIDIGRAFDDDDDWLEGFTITVINNSDKAVTAMTVDMIFRREPGDTRLAVTQPLHFGPSPMRHEYLLRDLRKIIKIGQTADLQLSSLDHRTMTGRLQRYGYPNSIIRVELVIREVGFEDGSVLYSGTLWVQDPNTPNDPTKKIRADKLKAPGSQRHHASGLKHRKAINYKRETSFTKASFSSARSLHADECYQQDQPLPICCDSECECGVFADRVDPFSEGDYDTELSAEPCATMILMWSHIGLIVDSTTSSQSLQAAKAEEAAPGTASFVRWIQLVAPVNAENKVTPAFPVSRIRAATASARVRRVTIAIWQAVSFAATDTVGHRF